MGPQTEDTAAEHTGSRLLTGLVRLFDERVMGLLALIALATALGPMVFDVSPDVNRTLTVVECVLVGMFAAEFVLHYLLALGQVSFGIAMAMATALYVFAVKGWLK